MRYRLVFFPGIAADARLFARQLEAFPGSMVAPWLKPGRHESAGRYIGRQLERLGVDARAERGRIIPVGQSFGGWMALAGARVVDAPAAFIIANAPCDDALGDVVRRQVELLDMLPDWGIPLFGKAYKAVHAMKMMVRRVPTHDLERMPLGFPSSLLTWARDVVRTEPRAPEDCRVYRSYGTDDPVVEFDRLPEGSSVDLVVEGGDHAFVYEHAEAVNAWIGQRLDELDAAEVPEASARA